MVDKKFIFIIILLILASIFSWRFNFKQYVQEDTVSIHSFPKEINGWKSQELEITDDEYAILETRNAFVRKYSSASGQEITLFIIYSQSNRKVSHPPEICYTGGGNTVVSKEIRDIRNTDGKMLIKANKLYLESSSVNQISFYWFKVGSKFTSNYWKQQFLIALNNILGKQVSSALIRVSSVIDEGDAVKSEKDVIDFSRLIISDLFKHLP